MQFLFLQWLIIKRFLFILTWEKSHQLRMITIISFLQTHNLFIGFKQKFKKKTHQQQQIKKIRILNSNLTKNIKQRFYSHLKNLINILLLLFLFLLHSFFIVLVLSFLNSTNLNFSTIDHRSCATCTWIAGWFDWEYTKSRLERSQPRQPPRTRTSSRRIRCDGCDRLCRGTTKMSKLLSNLFK